MIHPFLKGGLHHSKRTVCTIFQKAGFCVCSARYHPNHQGRPLYSGAGDHLSESKYRRFQADLLAETPFIAARTHLTGYSEKSGRFRCLLVSTRKRQDGILVDSEGYAYARYAAYVRDKRELDLAGVPRDNLNLKARER